MNGSMMDSNDLLIGMTDQKKITSILAAVYGQEEMFRVMLQFVKEVLPDDELQTALISKNRFLHGAFWDAMTSGKIETLQLIMKAVKEIVGPESQLTLVKSMRSTIVKHSRLINILAKTMTEDDPVGFEFFNTLIFHDERNINALEHIDAQFLSKSISAEGRVNWMKRLLDAAIKTPGDFISLLPNLLDKFSNEELECFLTMNSKWAKLVRGMCKDHYAIFYANNLEGTFKCVLRRLGAQAVEQLIFCDNGQLVEWIALGGYTQILDVMLAALPMDWNEHQRRYRHMVPVTRFCLLCGSKEQLSEFANSATAVREAGRNKDREAFVKSMAKILDAEAIKILLLHDIGKGAFLVRLMLWEGTRTVWALLDLLPADLRELLDILLDDEGRNEVIRLVDYLLSNADIKRYGGTLTKNWGKVKKRMNVEDNEASRECHVLQGRHSISRNKLTMTLETKQVRLCNEQSSLS